MRKDISDIFEEEFNKIKSIEGVKIDFLNHNEKDLKQIFGFVFVINYFKNRVETKMFFDEKFNNTFSLLLESIFALYSGQCRSALIMLRSAQESNLRYVLEKEREFIKIEKPEITFQSLDFRFKDTCNKFLADIENEVDKEKFSEYYLTINRNLTFYKNLSGVVHSESSVVPISPVAYFSKLHENTIVNIVKYFKLFLNVIEQIFLLNYFLIRKSLIHWDKYDLQNILLIISGKKRTETLIRIIK